jgi:hypothetical protein
MKVRFTTAARIAEASMKMTWKENLLLFIAIAVLPLLALGIPLFIFLVELVAAVALLVFTGNAVMAHANTITYTGVAVTCIVGAWLFAKARETKPRKFFDLLARGGFWYCTSIAATLSFIGFVLFVKA